MSAWDIAFRPDLYESPEAGLGLALDEDGSERPIREVGANEARPVQMKGGQKNRRKDGDKGKIRIPYAIAVTEPMSDHEFRVVAMKQVFGEVIENVAWRNSKPRYTPDQSPYTLLVDSRLVHRERGKVNAEHGFDINEETGGICPLISATISSPRSARP